MNRAAFHIFVCLGVVVGPAVLWPEGGGMPTAHAEVVQTGDAVDTAKLIKVQAAFLLNFAKFTTWPRSAFNGDDAPLVITIVGDDNVDGVSLADVYGSTLHDRKVGAHSIVVRGIGSLPSTSDAARRAQALKDLADTHVLFLAAGADLSAAEIRELNRSDVLTVGAVPADTHRGAMLAFGVDEGKVVFFYNAEAVHGSGLILSSKLLSLARIGN